MTADIPFERLRTTSDPDSFSAFRPEFAQRSIVFDQQYTAPRIPNSNSPSAGKTRVSWEIANSRSDGGDVT
jgi:hypothetical protein